MTLLYFVTPAWLRYEIVAICLEQRQRVIAELARMGIEGRQVVIADDGNVDIARALGCDVVIRPNRRDMVGQKFNDGMQHAMEQGADWIVPIGSDSWIEAEYFRDLPEPGLTRTSPAYCSVTRNTLAPLWVSPHRLGHSAGPYVFHRSQIEAAAGRPSLERSKSVDTDTIKGIEKATGQRIRWQVHTVHAYQYVGFRVSPMMTTHRSLVRHWLRGRDLPNPWELLPAYYPQDLVDRAQAAMKTEAKQ